MCNNMLPFCYRKKQQYFDIFIIKTITTLYIVFTTFGDTSFCCFIYLHFGKKALFFISFTNNIWYNLYCVFLYIYAF